MKKNIDAMNHPTKVKESIGERIYTILHKNVCFLSTDLSVYCAVA